LEAQTSLLTSGVSLGGDRKNTGLGTWLPCNSLQIGFYIRFSYALNGPNYL